jgi:hypothetical protein
LVSIIQWRRRPRSMESQTTAARRGSHWEKVSMRQGARSRKMGAYPVGEDAFDSHCDD